MHTFQAEIAIIGINPYVSVPDDILAAIFAAAGRDKGSIPIHGSVNDKPFTQTLVRYAGQWRLYINTTMLRDSPKRVGETITVCVDYDASERTTPMHPALQKALDSDIEAQQVFDSLSPSLQKEIKRYINNLKTEAKVQENVMRAINFLHGKGRFAGREL